MKRSLFSKSSSFNLFSFSILCFTINFVLLISAPTWGKTIKIKKTINASMKNIGDEMLALFPYMVSKNKFIDPKNESFIEKKLEHLEKMFQEVGPHLRQKAVLYKVSHEVMLDHLRETSRVFKSKNKEFAQKMARSITGICMSCHVLDGRQKTLFLDVSRPSFSSDLEFAEFLFMTRNFHKAQKYYDQFLRSTEKEDSLSTIKLKENIKDNAIDSNEERLAAWRRTLYVLSIEMNNDTLAIARFQEALDGKNISKSESKLLQSWIEALKVWTTKSKPFLIDGKLKFKKSLELLNFVEKNIPQEGQGVFADGMDEITYLKLADLITRFLNAHPEDSEVPTLLYEQARCERALNRNIFYSMADMSLRECMRSYSGHPSAKKCFTEFKDFTIFSYSGSAGTDLPKEVKDELNYFKKKVGAESEK